MKSSRHAIHDLMMRYARHSDRGEYDAVGELFAHGTFVTTRGDAQPGSEIAASRKRGIVHHDGGPGTRHITTNVMIDVDEGADSARARAYFTLLQATPELPLQVAGAGRYYDRFERAGGEWRFGERLTILDLYGDLSQHLGGFRPRDLPYDVPIGGPLLEELPPMPLPAEPQAAIETLIYSYAERYDLGDVDGVGRLFAHGPRRSGRNGPAYRGEELASVLRRYVQSHDGNPRTKHVTTNVLVEVDSDVASARSYFTVVQATRALPLQVIAAGRYHDRFERVDGAWRFAERVILLDLRGDVSEHAAPGARSRA